MKSKFIFITPFLFSMTSCYVTSERIIPNSKDGIVKLYSMADIKFEISDSIIKAKRFCRPNRKGSDMPFDEIIFFDQKNIKYKSIAQFSCEECFNKNYSLTSKGIGILKKINDTTFISRHEVYTFNKNELSIKNEMQNLTRKEFRKIKKVR